MIHIINPYTPTKQLAECYNWYANNLPVDDWICFLDADAMFLNPLFGQQLEAIIKQHRKDYLAFTCMTNRVGNLQQCYGGKISNNFDVKRHYRIAKGLWESRHSEVVEIKPNPPMSGVLIMASVQAFRSVPFMGDGMLGVDNNFHEDISKVEKFGLMTGVYVFHKYRIGNIYNKEHLV